MALNFQGISIRKDPVSPRVSLTRTNVLESRKFHFLGTNSRSHIKKYKILTHQHRLSVGRRVAAYFEERFGDIEKPMNRNSNTSFDAFLSGIEFLSLASSAVVFIYLAVKHGLQSGGTLGFLERKALAWQCVVLVCGLTVGVLIRRRQWDRICGAEFSRPPASGLNLLDRVEILEQELRNYTIIIQGLARRLEKLGIRFRVSRRTLKQPIAETAALVQKTAEATQALAAQEKVLEKELGEIQKVLLAMQEQQQKQLELILAIGKTSKLLGGAPLKNKDGKASEVSKLFVDEEVAAANSGMAK